MIAQKISLGEVYRRMRLEAACAAELAATTSVSSSWNTERGKSACQKLSVVRRSQITFDGTAAEPL
jgi:hypothetical protein